MKPLLFMTAIAAIIVLPGFRPSANSTTGTEMFMLVKSAKQGDFRASNAQTGGLIKLTNISFNDQALSDAGTAKAKGTQQHQVIKVTKPLDASSAQFLTAFMSHEMFPTVIFEYITRDKEGKTTIVMKLTLTGANMSDFKQSGSSETISFTYKDMAVEG